MGYHIKEAITYYDGVYLMDYPKVLISKGELRGLEDSTVTPADDQVIDLTWDDNSGQGYANADDQLMVVVYDESMDIYQLFEGIARRDEAGANLPMPAFLSGLKVEVWASFATANGKDAATSSYLGAVQLS